MLRWYQVGIWYPFFRGHAHQSTRRREPWLAGEVADDIADAIRLRYKLMPVWYTAFYESSETGAPILQPIFWNDASIIDIYGSVDDVFFVGDSGLLVKPLADDSDNLLLPSSSVYYNFSSGVLSSPVSGFGDNCDIILKGGSVLPTLGRQRRSTAGSLNDPYTLYVGLDHNGSALGKLYRDDDGLINFKVENNVLSITPTIPKIEKIVVINPSGQQIEIRKPRFESLRLQFEFTKKEVEHDEL